jgi:hypothetical protein
MRLLLGCAGYLEAEAQVVGEFFGTLPACQAAQMPGVGCADTLVAVVRPPDDDQDLQRLPRCIKSPFMGTYLSIQVQGHGVQLPPYPAQLPNPLRQHERAFRKAFKSKAYREHEAHRELCGMY